MIFTQKLHDRKVNKHRSPRSETRYRTFATIPYPHLFKFPTTLKKTIGRKLNVAINHLSTFLSSSVKTGSGIRGLFDPWIRNR
jgi:hypothetical protein